MDVTSGPDKGSSIHTMSTYMTSKQRQLWLDGEFCDFEIKTEEQSFQVHKIIMAAASDYFHAMLRHGMKESQENSVDIKAITATGLAPLLDFIYGGDLKITEANVMDILTAASHLQVKPAVELCSRHLCSTVTLENVFDVMKIADVFHLEEIHEQIDNFIAENFQAFAEKKLHVELTAQQFIRYLPRNDLNVESEEELLKIVGEWFQQDLSNRSKYSLEVLQSIRFPLMDTEDMKSIVSKEPFTTLDTSFHKLLEEAENYQSLQVHEQVVNQSPRTEVRSKPALVAFSGTLRDDYYYKPDEPCNWQNSTSIFTLQDNKWLALDKTVYQEENNNASVAVLDNFLFVCGGFYAGGEDAHAECFIFDPRFSRWVRISNMCCKRVDFPLVAGNDSVYAVGGSDGFSRSAPVSSIEKYIPQENKWVEIGNLSLTKQEACFVDGKIYLAGGRDEQHRESKRLQAYNPAINKWEEKSPMHGSHSFLAMLSVGHEIYVIDTFTRKIELYSVSTDQWTVLDCKIGPFLSGAVHVGNSLYFLGGQAKPAKFEEEGELLCGGLNLETKEPFEVRRYPEEAKSTLAAALAIPQKVTNKAKVKTSVYEDSESDSDSDGFI